MNTSTRVTRKRARVLCQLAAELLASGAVTYVCHAFEELARDGLCSDTEHRVLKGMLFAVFQGPEASGSVLWPLVAFGCSRERAQEARLLGVLWLPEFFPARLCLLHSAS